MTYEEFISRKTHLSGNFGFDPVYIPDFLFDYQKHILTYAVRKGRFAMFADTGLGKTAIQLAIAQNLVMKTNKPVLILTPLAVAFQFLLEAEKMQINDVQYSKDGRYTGKIIVTNYERIHYFDSDNFSGVLCDESSILKNFDGAIKNQVTAFLKKREYRGLSTATPSPNDFIELGTSSEALGYLGYMDMLSKFFKNNQNSIDVRHAGSEWYLKPHAENDFWRWVASWSISVKKPSDIGFSDANHVLPNLIENQWTVKNTNQIVVNDQIQLFNLPAVNFFEIKSEVRATIKERCELAVEKAASHDTSVYWANLNDEAALIKQLDKKTVEVKGNMDIDEKEEILTAFSRGEIKKLITKTSITAFGLNWQHCNHTTYFPTYSYEQYYQAIRRFWRFGQKRDVIVDNILSDGQSRIVKSIDAKKEKAVKMFEKLTTQTNADFTIKKKEFNKEIILPNFV